MLEVCMEFVGICLITQDVPLLADFYKRVLQVEADGDDTHVELGTRGAHISIFSEQGMEGLAPGSMQGAGKGGFTIGFEVGDVDAEYARLAQMGASFVKPPQTHPWGARSFWFRDPDGNLIDFYAWTSDQRT
jgi:catechol 2,3-dioxygenase-like lactoylglutathione lyase family enzyme